jgi:hypothetical protein
MRFRDVRVLSALLLATAGWDALFVDPGGRAAPRGSRAGEAARPDAGGFAALHAAGPDGVVAEEAARRAYFGKDLAWLPRANTPASPASRESKCAPSMSGRAVRPQPRGNRRATNTKV